MIDNIFFRIMKRVVVVSLVMLAIALWIWRLSDNQILEPNKFEDALSQEDSDLYKESHFLKCCGENDHDYLENIRLFPVKSSKIQLDKNSTLYKQYAYLYTGPCISTMTYNYLDQYKIIDFSHFYKVSLKLKRGFGEYLFYYYDYELFDRLFDDYVKKIPGDSSNLIPNFYKVQAKSPERKYSFYLLSLEDIDINLLYTTSKTMDSKLKQMSELTKNTLVLFPSGSNKNDNNFRNFIFDSWEYSINERFNLPKYYLNRYFDVEIKKYNNGLKAFE